MSQSERRAYYHLPGLFEFYELYRRFLPLYFHHREYFYDWCELGSVYGAPSDCIWGGGRIENGEADPDEVLSLLQKYDISACLTSAISFLQKNIFLIRNAMRYVRAFKTGKALRTV